MQKSGHMVLKGVNWVHSDKLGLMVLKAVNWVHIDKKGVNYVENDKIWSNGLERSQLVTQ